MFLLFHVLTLHLALNSSAVKCDSERKSPLISESCLTLQHVQKTSKVNFYFTQTDMQRPEVFKMELLILFNFFPDFSPILCTQVHISKCYRFSMAFMSCLHILDCGTHSDQLVTLLRGCYMPAFSPGSSLFQRDKFLSLLEVHMGVE